MSIEKDIMKCKKIKERVWFVSFWFVRFLLVAITVKIVFIYLFILCLLLTDLQLNIYTYKKKRLAVHKGKPLMTLIDVNTKCAYLESH